MKNSALYFLMCALALAPMPSAFAQSQALDGQIEGTVSDQIGAAVPNAVVEVTNLETGLEFFCAGRLEADPPLKV